MGLSAFYGAPESDEQRFKVLDRAYELGECFWDTADMYQDSEDLLGKWFKRTGKKNEIFLATKFANIINEDGSAVINSTPEYYKKACTESLQRLGIDTIDLYYCHRVDQKTPIKKTVEAIVELKTEGKIKYLGLSEVSSATLRRACQIHHIDAVQIEYSPFSMDIENPNIALMTTCRELGVAIVCYAPLGRGFLTGQYTSPNDFEENDFRRFAPRFSKENFPKNLGLVDRMVAIAKRKGCTAGQLTLSWLLAQGDDIIPIPGTKKVKYLEENIGSLEVQLTKAEINEIRNLIEPTRMHGSRYPGALMNTLLADTPAL